MAAVGTLTPGMVVHEIELHCTSGNSDKLYRLRRVVSRDGATFDVTAESCRRGSHYISQGIKIHLATEWQAEGVITKIIDEKQAKGYRIITDFKAPAATTPAPAPAPPKKPRGSAAFAEVPAASGQAPKPLGKPGLRPVVAARISPNALPDLLCDTSIAMHGTLGGILLVVGSEGGKVFGVDTDGYESTLPPSLVTVLASIGIDYAIEGELADGVFYAWDIRKVDGRDVRSASYADRRFELNYLLCGRTVDASILRPVFVEDSADKAPFYFMLEDEGAKSVIFRSLVADGTSPEGKPLASMFSSEIKAFVCGVVGNGRRIEVALHPVTNLHPNYHNLPVEWRGLPAEMTLSIGFVDLPEGQARPKLGSVVRLSYEDIQPMKGGNKGLGFLGVVEDGKDEDCNLGQIRFQP